MSISASGKPEDGLPEMNLSREWQARQGREEFQAENKILLALFAGNRSCVLSTSVMPRTLERGDEQFLRAPPHGALQVPVCEMNSFERAPSMGLSNCLSAVRNLTERAPSWGSPSVVAGLFLLAEPLHGALQVPVYEMNFSKRAPLMGLSKCRQRVKLSWQSPLMGLSKHLSDRHPDSPNEGATQNQQQPPAPLPG